MIARITMFIEKSTPATPQAKFHTVELAARKSWRRQRRVSRLAARLH